MNLDNCTKIEEGYTKQEADETWCLLQKYPDVKVTDTENHFI